jgi:ribosomal protein S27E
MKVECSLRADADGFISQHCPHCDKRFKAVFGNGSDKPLSYCPYCGSKGENWWTPEQMQYLDLVARGMPDESNAPMVIKNFDCHGEQIKHDGSTNELHCPICGELPSSQTPKQAVPNAPKRRT